MYFRCAKLNGMAICTEFPASSYEINLYLAIYRCWLELIGVRMEQGHRSTLTHVADGVEIFFTSVYNSSGANK